MPLTNKKISAVVTCYNDAPAIPIMLERLHAVLGRVTSDYEIIYVVDGSPDNSEEVLREFAKRDPCLTVILHSRNFNSQNAFTSGMMQALGDAVVLLDGDLQDPPELIEAFARKWLEGYDVVYGVRTKREATKFLQAAYKLFYRAMRKLSYIRVPLDAGDFALMDRKVVDAMNALPETDRFLRGLRAWVGFRQTGVEYLRPERMFGQTTNSLVKNIRWAKKGIFSFTYAPLEWISYLTAVVILASMAALLVYLVGYFFFPRGPRGIQTVIVLVLFLGSIQVFCLTIIGEYVGRIFEETKRRSMFIRREIINDHRKQS